MQLVAYGAQDVYLTADPTITFWKAVYRRYTNFAMESMSQTFTGIPRFGNRATVRISRNGDLMGKTYLNVTLPDLTNLGPSYLNRVGFRLIKSVELRIGGQSIDKQYSTWMHIWSELTHSVDMKALLDKMVGLKEVDGVSAYQKNPGTLNIPLMFFYCRNPGLAIPLIALQYHEVELWFEFETLANCLTDNNIYNIDISMINPMVWVDYIFLDTEERKEFAQKPHEYLIEIVQTQDSSISSTGTSSTRLTFNHPTKFISWVLRDPVDKCAEFDIISCGGFHVAAINLNGTLWSWGYNYDGELGQGNSDNYRYNIPTQVGTDNNWAKVVCGSYATFAIKSDGSLWATGYNYYGQLGLGDTYDRNIFTKVGDDIWKDISTSGYHSFGIKEDGTLWATGGNWNGELGFGDTVNRDVFTQVGIETDWKQVITNFVSEGGFTFAIKNDGFLWATGINGEGELGLGNNDDYNVFTQVGSALWTKVNCGSYHTTGIQSDGSLWSWGYNSNGQLGLGNTTNYNTPQLVDSGVWTKVNNGYAHSCALKSDGTVWLCGLDNYGQLGNGSSYTDINIFTQYGTDTDWVNINTGFNFTYIIKNTDDAIYVTGENYGGELGLGYTTINNKPIKSPNTFKTIISNKYGDGNTPNFHRVFNVGITDDNKLWGWGDNDKGQFGKGSNVSVYYIPTEIGTDNSITWKSVGCGVAHIVAIKSDGTLWAAGYNAYGQLAQDPELTPNSNIFIQIGTANNWTKVSCGALNTYVINEDGELWSCGYNIDGQCGIGSSGLPVIELTQEDNGDTDWMDVNAGDYHVLALKTDNTLYSWGYNVNGQLGRSDSTIVPIQVGTSTWSQISCGMFYSMVLNTNGTIWGCGNNEYGQLGNNTTINSPILVQEVTNSTNWTFINAGPYSSFGIKSDKSLWGWGYNGNGQLGTNDYIERIIPTMVGGYRTWTSITSSIYTTHGIMEDGSNWAWGYNNYYGFYTYAIDSFINQPCVTTDVFTAFGSYNTNVSTTKSAKLRLNGQDRFNERDSTYFNYIQPYQHFNVKPDIGICVYSFALKPANNQPSGSCNLSRIDNVNLDITPTLNSENIDNLPLQLSVYAFSYNVFRVASGMGGLAFSN